MKRRSLVSTAVAATAAAGIWSRPWALRPAVAGNIHRIPDVEVQAHDGSRYRFYSDLIKDRIVTVNFMFASCGEICPLVTANLRRVQEMLGDHVGRDIFMYSITLEPELDTPDILRDYALHNEIGEGWRFLTGEPRSIEQIRRALGFANTDPELDIIKDEHTGLLRYGNERLDRWSGCPALASPEWIVKSITSSLAVG
jgi:protein SCO1/2